MDNIDILKEKVDKLSETVSRLKKSEQLFTTAIDNAPIGMITLTPDGDFRTVNKVFCKITGYSKTELLDLNISKITHPEDKQIGKKVIKDLTSGKSDKAQFNKRYVHKNGRIIHAQVNTVLLKDNSDNPVSFFTQIIDISTQKEYHQNLIESEKKYKSLVESARDGIIVLQNDIIKYANKHVAKIYGKSNNDIIGNSFLIFVHPDSVDMVNQRNTLRKKGEKIPNTFEVNLVDSKKNKRICEIHSSTTTFNSQSAELVVIHDITKTKIVQKTIEKVNKELAMQGKTIEEMNECVSITDREHKIIFVNEAFVKTYGYKREEIIGKTGSILHAENAPDLIQDIRMNTKLGGWKGELINKRKDGKAFPIELSVTPLKDKTDKIIAQIGISSNISDRKRTELALLESEEKYRYLFDNSPLGIASLNDKGDILKANQNMLTILGSPSHEEIKELKILKDKPLIDVGFVEAYLKCLKNGKIVDINFKTTTKWKKNINVRCLLSPINDAGNNIIGVQTIFEDISERALAEEKIRQSEESFRDLFNSASDALYIQDKNGQYLDVNNGACKMYGYPREYFIGKTPASLSAPGKNDLKKVARHIEKTFKGEPQKFEFWGKRKNGEEFPKLVRMHKGKYFTQDVIIVFAQDITERKNTEKILVESEARYRKFFIEDLTGNYLATRDGKIIDCNPQFLKIFGFKSLKEAQNYDAVKLYRSKSDREKFIKKLEREKLLRDHQSEQHRVNGGKIIIRENVLGEFDDNDELVNVRGYLYDVTKQVKAEKEIKTLSTAVAQSSVAIIITDANGNIEYVNPTFEKLTGYMSEEAIGKNPSILKSEVTPESDYKNLWDTISKGGTWVGEFVNKKKNGELYWESATISPIYDDENNITHYLAVKEETTKHMQMITDLMEREEKYRTLTQNLNVGVYRNTPGHDGIFTEINPAFLKMFGFRSKNELERYKVVDFFPDANIFLNVEKKLNSKGFLINEELKLRKKDGTIFDASISATSAKDELGKIIHYDGIIEDITERKNMMEKIVNERDRSQLYLDIAGVMFLALDRNGNIILANQKTSEIIGESEEKLIGVNWFDNYIPKEIRTDVKKVFLNLIKMEDDMDEFYENEIITTSGKKRLISWHNVTLRDKDGKVFGIVSSGLDITESKKDEELQHNLYKTSLNLTESLDLNVVLNRMSKQARILLQCSGVTIYMLEDDNETLNPVVANDPPYTKQVLATKLRIDNSLTGSVVKNKKGKIFNYKDNPKGAYHIKGTPKKDTDNIMISPFTIDGKVIGAITLIRPEIPFSNKELNIANTIAVYGSTAIKNANSHKQLKYEIEERKQTQLLLKESHTRYESIFNGAVDGIIYTDLMGNILSVNSSFTKMVGMKESDLIGKNGLKIIKKVLPEDSINDIIKVAKNISDGKAIDGFPIEYNNRALEIYTSEEKSKPGVTIIVRDVTERNKAQKNLTLHQKNLEEVSNELTMVEEQARRRLAVTLHDKLGQSLVLANFKSNELMKIVEKQEHQKLISEVNDFLEDAINESRTITYELSPPVLYEMGLIPAVSWKLDEIEKSNSIKTSLINQTKDYEIEKREQIVLYRTINELLNNVLKHSQADKVNVTFRLLSSNYRIIISDNGIGFDFSAMRDKAISQKKFGLFSIMERIKYIGGTVEIDAKPGKGTRILISMPIKN